MQILSQVVRHVGNSSKQSHDLSSRQSNSPPHTMLEEIVDQ
uniref:Cell division cycle, putative n=1 Tax=Arundo donax TaxID=35708 RepID=A0A0A9E978_ARUDO